MIRPHLEPFRKPVGCRHVTESRIAIEDGLQHREGALGVPELPAVLTVHPEVSDRVFNAVTSRVVLPRMLLQTSIAPHALPFLIPASVNPRNPPHTALH